MVKPIMKKDGCLYCPDCKSRIGIREPKPFGCVGNRVIIYGFCTCLNVGNEWNFEFTLDPEEFHHKERDCKKCLNYEGCWILQEYRDAKKKIKELGLEMTSNKKSQAKKCPYFNKTIGKTMDYKPKWSYYTH